MIPITSAEVYAWFFIHVGVLLVAAAWLTVSAILFPGITGRGATSLARRPWLAFIIGFALFLLGVILFAVMQTIPLPAAKFIAVLVGLGVITFGLFGAGGLVRALASRVPSTEAMPTLRLLYGISLLVVLTWMLPGVGWFFALPMTLMLGLGSLVLSRSGKPPRATKE